MILSTGHWGPSIDGVRKWVRWTPEELKRLEEREAENRYWRAFDRTLKALTFILLCRPVIEEVDPFSLDDI